MDTSVNQYSNMRLMSTDIQLWTQSELMQQWQLSRFSVLYLILTFLLVVSIGLLTFLGYLHPYCRLIHLMKNLRSWLEWALKRYFKLCPECQFFIALSTFSIYPIMMVYCLIISWPWYASCGMLELKFNIIHRSKFLHVDSFFFPFNVSAPSSAASLERTSSTREETAAVARSRVARSWAWATRSRSSYAARSSSARWRDVAAVAWVGEAWGIPRWRTSVQEVSSVGGGGVPAMEQHRADGVRWCGNGEWKKEPRCLIPYK